MNYENDNFQNVEAELLPEEFDAFIENIVDESITNINFIIDYLSQSLLKEIWRISISTPLKGIVILIPKINQYLFLKSLVNYLSMTPHFGFVFKVDALLVKVIISRISKN